MQVSYVLGGQTAGLEQASASCSLAVALIRSFLARQTWIISLLRMVTMMVQHKRQSRLELRVIVCNSGFRTWFATDQPCILS